MSNVLAVVLIVVVAVLAWRWYSAPRKYVASSVNVSRKPTLGSVPNGTPLRLADAMRLSVDNTFPRIEDSTVKVIHGDDEPRQYIDEVVRRLTKNGAKVTPLAAEVAQFSKFIDSKGVARFDLKFIVYDRTLSQPGYPADHVVKLVATFLQGPQDKAKLYSLGFATPRNPIGGPDAYDARASMYSRFQSPLEILKQMDLSPTAEVQV